MRTIAFLIMTSCLLLLIGVTRQAFTISVSEPPGLLNPTIHFSVHPEYRDLFFATLLAATISAYCFAMIAWTEQKLNQLRALIAGTRSKRVFIQPPDVRLLKNAIRAGNLTAVRKCAKESAFRVTDERYLTPLELADLYERQPIVDALRAAMLKHAQKRAAPGQQVAVPSSPFALRQD